MRALRSLLLVGTILVAVCGAAFAENTPLPPQLTRALLQARTVYIVSGHVRYFKTKAFVKTEIVDTTPFEEPCRKELEKWGRFKIVPDIKDADLVIRAYMTGDSRSVPVSTSGIIGSVDVGQSFVVLDVVQPSSRKILWSASKNIARSWSTKSAVSGLVKKLRDYVETQEKSVQALNGTASPGMSPATN